MIMEKIIENVRLDEERALYGSKNLKLKCVSFDGPADGESALKECENISVEDCFCNLRYPFWHVRGLSIKDTEMTPLCRAALWYSDDVRISDSKLHGIKALRECSDVKISGCDIISPEFGWSVSRLQMKGGSVESEYFLLRAENVVLDGVQFKGKYSFQYVKGGLLENCRLQTKDAFWHAKDITVKNCVVKGEYLGWYSDGLTFENCIIEGTQPLCYCKNLRLLNCAMTATDLCFERSYVNASITTDVVSIKNLYGGKVTLPSVGEIIKDDSRAVGEIIITGNKSRAV